MITTRHTHDTSAEPCIWHDGSLADCPESKWTEVLLEDGRKAKFYHGMSVTMPPDTTRRFRYIDKAEPIV